MKDSIISIWNSTRRVALAAIMALLIALTASTAFAQTYGSVSITNADAGTYHAYRLFTGSFAEFSEDGETVTRMGDAVLNTGYSEAVLAALEEVGYPVSDEDAATYGYETVADMSERALANAALDEIAAIAAADSGATATQFADTLAALLEDGGYEPTLETQASDSIEFSGMEPGYWIVCEATDGAYDATSVMSAMLVLVSGSETAEYIVKNEVPTLSKWIWEDYTGVEGWYKSADAGYGEEVPYKLVGTLPSNYADFSSYYYCFHDDFDDRCEIDAASVSVVWTSGNDDIDVTDYFTVVIADGTMSVECEDLKAIDGVAYGDTFTVYYTASLIYDEAGIGTEDYEQNFAYLEYTAKPYSEAHGTTPEDTCKLYSWELDVIKVDDGTGETLYGATYYVYSDLHGAYLDGAGNLVSTPTEIAASSDGVLYLHGIDSGDYVVTEVTAPSGYELAEPFTISVVSHAETGEPEFSVTVSGEDAELVSSNGTGGIAIVRLFDEATPVTIITLVQTGSPILLIGLALVAAGAVAIVLSARRRHKDNPAS